MKESIAKNFNTHITSDASCLSNGHPYDIADYRDIPTIVAYGRTDVDMSRPSGARQRLDGSHSNTLHGHSVVAILVNRLVNFLGRDLDN